MFKLILSIIFFLSVTIASAQPLVPSKTYIDSANDITFQYPANLIKGNCSELTGVKNCVGFKKNQNDEDYLITIQLEQISLQTAVDNDGLFQKVDGKWVKNGKDDTTPANEISGKGWTGLIGTASCGVDDRRGNEHTGFCTTTIIHHGGVTLTIEEEGIEDNKYSNAIINSLSFTK